MESLQMAIFWILTLHSELCFVFDVSERRTASIFMVTELVLSNADMMRWNQMCRLYYRKVPGNTASDSYGMQFTLKMETGRPSETALTNTLTAL